MKDLPSSQPNKRPFLIRIGKALRPVFNKLIARDSLIPNTPVLDPDIFPWTQILQRYWQDIAREFHTLNAAGTAIPPLRALSPDHTRIAPDTRWKSFFLYGYGVKVPENCARMPKTAELISRIPDLNSAFFSVLEPDAVIPPHYGVTKGLITCHLGISVPRNADDCWIRVAGQKLVWHNGQCLLFDDTYQHDVHNNTSDTRIVLLMQIRRPTKGMGRIVQNLFLNGIRRSAFVKDAQHNIAQWNQLQGTMKAA